MENLIAAIPTALRSADQEFTTHQLILELAKSNQHAYIEALQDNLDAEEPFTILHSRIGKYLKQSSDLVSLVNDGQSSINIFGNRSSCALWQKIA